MFKETGILGCKLSNTLIKSNHGLGEKNEEHMANWGIYQRVVVGKLVYLSHIRPNIAYVVSMVSQFMNSPNKSHI